MSRHFAFVIPPGHGHVNPTLPLVEELLGRGHRVTYATGPPLLPAVAKTGAATVELPWALGNSLMTRGVAGTGFTAERMANTMNWFLDDAGLLPDTGRALPAGPARPGLLR